MTEARRLAKEVVKNEIRAAGMKISFVEASVITKAANELIAADPSFIENAKANIEARSAVKSAINIANLVHESPKLVAKAEAARPNVRLSFLRSRPVRLRLARRRPRKPRRLTNLVWAGERRSHG